MKVAANNMQVFYLNLTFTQFTLLSTSTPSYGNNMHFTGYAQQHNYIEKIKNLC